MNAEALKTAIETLPSDLRQELDRMRLAGRGLFGNTTTQKIVDWHLDLLLRIREEHQADHADLALLLHFHGISGPDDQPLTVGTVSSAISRAVRARCRARVQTLAKPFSRLVEAGARSKRKRIAVRDKADGPDAPMAPAPARSPIVLERLDLAPVMMAPPRHAEDAEIRRADHHARLVTLLDPSTQED